MTELAEDRPEAPKPPSPMSLLAVLLELSIAADILAHRLWLGVALCVGYFYFSATRALLFDKWLE